MVVTKTEWLSLRLHSEEIYNLVSKLDVLDQVFSEASLALELESELICMITLTQQLRGQIQASPKTNINPELLS